MPAEGRFVALPEARTCDAEPSVLAARVSTWSPGWSRVRSEKVVRLETPGTRPP
jgi:hypothetical protein